MPDPGSADGLSNRRRFLKLTAATGAVSSLPLVEAAPTATGEYQSDFKILPFTATASDGVDLNGHVYLPENHDPPFATVLYWSPYWNTAIATPSDDPPSEDGSNETQHAFGGIHRLIQEGFAVAAVNLRGTGISEGCFQWGSPVDFDDGYVVVEALADEPWSNGKIGMYGLSYDAYSQTLAIAGDPPSLEAVVPVDGVIDLWKFYMQQGAPLKGASVYPAAIDALVAGSAVPHDPERVDCPRRLRDWTVGADMAASGNRNAWFQQRNYLDDLAESRVPMFAVLGQIGVEGQGTNGHTLQIEGLYEARPPNTTRLLLGDWGHVFPDERDFMQKVVDWFDHHLRDGPNKVKTGVVEYKDDTESWHTTNQWPPRADRTELYLSGASLVSDPAAVESSSQRFQSEHHAPGLDPRYCGPRQVVYTSPPIDSPVRIAGNASITATITSTLSGGNLAALLFHTPGPGTCPDSEATPFARVLASLRHWKTMGRAQRLPINEPTPVTFESQSFATDIPAGNRIVLAVSGGASSLQPNERQPLLEISTGDDHPGHIDLPVVDGDLTFRQSMQSGSGSANLSSGF